MRIAFRNTASYIAILLVIIGFVGTAPATDICFILQKVKVQPNAKPATSLVDQLVRCDAAGKGVRVLHEGPRNSMRAVTVATDGTVLLFETGKIVGANASPQILIIKSDGSVSKTVNLAAINGRVFGSPFLLPDQKHIGLTFCKPDPQTPDPKPAPGPFEQRQFESAKSVFAQWSDGQLQSPPIVAVVDLDGKNLKEIGPGALPRWSADGKTILFSAIVMEDQGMSRKILLRPTASRLSVMDADGKNAHPIAGERTFDGVFSPDGKQIAYVHADDKTPAIYVCDADGSHARKAGDLATCSATPRWSATSIAFRRQPLVPGSIIASDESGIWVVASDGTGLHRGSPDLDAATVDRDAAVLTYAVTRAELIHPAGPVNDDPDVKPVPAGQKLVYEGTKVFFRDAAGHNTPVPDGAYRLPNGWVVHVRNGNKV